MKRHTFGLFDASLIAGSLILLLVLSAIHQGRIERLETDLEILRGGSGVGDAALIQRVNILENAFDLRLDYLEAGEVRPSAR